MFYYVMYDFILYIKYYVYEIFEICFLRVFFNDLIIKIINCYVIFRIIGLDWGGDELD